MGSVDYKKLYELQDKILDILFTTEDIFYLTGGTCLSRFYQEKRYSDDLDFFADNEPRFKVGIKNIKAKMQEEFTVYEDTVTKDFVRWIVDDSLQVDFVNDRVYRYGESILLENGYQIDNIHNILSNKLNAVIDRDEPKDIFDIYMISKFYSFSWQDILEASHKKAYFSHEDLIIRLKTFPLELIESINLIDLNFLDNFEKEFPLIIEEINEMRFHKATNRL
jgi:predicted nucleotidyltransferase component of viral defense system